MGSLLTAAFAAAKAAASKIGLLLLALAAALSKWIQSAADESATLLEKSVKGLHALAARAFAQSDEARLAVDLMVAEMYRALSVYLIALFAMVCIAAVCLLLTCLPLVRRALVRRRPRIFVSFQHLRESFARDVEEALGHAGFRPYRLPYQEGASHQHIVTEVNRALRRCDAVVCLPGNRESYVDIEVGAAAHGFKPIAFALPRYGGSLPNSADKRYPVFDLEAVAAFGYRPLAAFLHYVIGDLASGWQQLRRSARHPFVRVTMKGALALLGGLLAVLFAASYWQALTATDALVARGGAFAEMRSTTVLSGVVLLCALAALVLAAVGYTLLVVTELWRQWRAQRRASLKAGTADFARDDWMGIIPDMHPGSPLYDSLFNAAPAAHHEKLRAEQPAVPATHRRSVRPH